MIIDQAPSQAEATTKPDSGNLNMDEIERLAQTVALHGLTRLEYEHDGVRIVLEKAAAMYPSTNPVAAAVDTPSVDGTVPSPAVPATPSASGAAPIPGIPAPAAGAAGSGAASPAAATNAAAPNAAPGTTPDATLVSAPLVGVAYRAKDPDAAPFVSPGDRVEQGTVLCLIEAMKMFNEVKAPCPGLIQAVHFEDGKLVEHGAPLFSIV
jgi:acetyl-CoA carboxylase biotin carboxyl carrier protein